MDDLVRWLGEQLDQDAARATEAADGDSGEWFMGRKWNVYRVEDQTPNEEESNELVVWGNVKPQSEFIAEHDPARVLREIDAKRQIIAEHQPDRFGDCTTCARPEDFDEDADGNRTWSRSAKPWPCLTVRLLAVSYADRDGYRAEWAPTE